MQEPNSPAKVDEINDEEELDVKSFIASEESK